MKELMINSKTQPNLRNNLTKNFDELIIMKSTKKGENEEKSKKNISPLSIKEPIQAISSIELYEAEL